MKKKTGIIALLLAFLLLLSACGAPKSEPASPEEAAPADPGEAAAEAPAGESEAAILDIDRSHAAVTADNARVFYEIFVGSFSDSDGDGTGDLRGIINRFDYLNDGDPDSGLSLGIEGIWLTPIFTSPSYHKYDVSDYYTIDPAFGTMEDLEELIALCHSRNVKLILDLPINHTGKLNHWFSQFVLAHRQGQTDDPYYDFYCWYPAGETPPGRHFSPIAGTDDYYECNFDGAMPELNFDNEAVRQTVLDVAKFYLDKGVDGFRFDAAKYVYFGDNLTSADFWVWYIGELKKLNPELYTVAEVWDGDGITDLYYPALNCFDFTLSQSSGLIAETAKAGDAGKYAAYVQSYLERTRALRPDAMILPFVSNHDMDRAAGFLTVASGQMSMAANLYLLGPGSPFIYYGEEIGMRGSRGGANTDANRRLAMLWGDGDTVKDPSGSTYSAQEGISVAAQKGDPDSLYNYYKRLIAIRTANPEIARGDYRAVSVPDSKVGGFTATLDGSTVCVLHNTTISAKTVDLSALGLSFTQLCAVAGQESASLEDGILTIGAQTSVVLR